VSVERAFGEAVEVRVVDQLAEPVNDVGAEVFELVGELVGELGPAVGEDDDVVDVEAAQEVAVAAAFPGGELGGEDQRRGRGADECAEGSRRSTAVARASGYQGFEKPRIVSSVGITSSVSPESAWRQRQITGSPIASVKPCWRSRSPRR
jgi:hypothetical protein